MSNILATLLLTSVSFVIVAALSGLAWCWLNRSRLLGRKS
jgi:hypothetical protein